MAEDNVSHPGRPPGPGRIVQLFSNPASGSYSARRLRALREAFEAQGATVIETICRADAPVIAEEADHICVAGGDGTVRDIVNALARNGRPVGLSNYPMGTINLLAREARYPADPRMFVQRLYADQPDRSHFPVTVGDGLFIVCASVGPDSAAVARISPRLKKLVGRLAYVAAILPVLIRWSRPRIKLDVDGRVIACEAFYVAKGRYFAGPWSFAPGARVDQPKLHLVAFERMRRRDFAAFAWALLWRRPIERLTGTTCLTCTALSAESESPLPLQADGDILARLPVTIKLAETPLCFR